MKTLDAFLKTHRGSSFPTEARMTDGGVWIVKMRGSGNGAWSLVSEFFVNRVASACGWPVPDVSVVDIPDGFPWVFGSDEFDDLVQRSYGKNLGIRLIEDAHALSADDVLELPPSFLGSMATLDALSLNHDRTRMNPNVLVGGDGKPWLIDHGSCLFFAKSQAQRPLATPTGHLLSNFAPGRSPENLREAGRAAADELPEEWLTELGLDRAHVKAFWEARVDRIASMDGTTRIAPQ